MGNVARIQDILKFILCKLVSGNRAIIPTPVTYKDRYNKEIELESESVSTKNVILLKNI